MLKPNRWVPGSSRGKKNSRMQLAADNTRILCSRVRNNNGEFLFDSAISQKIDMAGAEQKRVPTKTSIKLSPHPGFPAKKNKQKLPPDIPASKAMSTQIVKQKMIERNIQIF
ncbi:MAG: hypothetical protein V4725_16655 [Bacteroidota bacterium]